MPFKLVTMMELAQVIENINLKKAHKTDNLYPRLLKKNLKTAIVMLKYLLNACFRSRTNQKCLKIVRIFMLKKPEKPAEQIITYHSISLLPVSLSCFKHCC